ncbi:NrdA Ribonucleotide reductase, alpha subunit [uncultured Caudovirales phage]|uniref:Ribonucleoside-diphosphate reductase n=1 Tax=uncultured Caudovirales phage TaxID=2100421 RepID=A0A6J5NYF8_9CAUD|nr:NrdA Ribonucleotide reductase, alpha subunit [uncultured Caudovirales phage]
MQIQVIKRNGSKEPLDLNRFHKVVSWACEGLNNVSASEIELKSHIQFHDGIKTSVIQETLIKAAADLISEDTPSYQYVAGRLINYHLRKQVYGSYIVPSLGQHINNVISEGYYDPDINEWYSQDEIDTLNGYIDHQRDYNIAYVGMEQFRGKYLIKNRSTGNIYETPQMAYMLIAMVLFRKYPKETRLKWVKDFYDATSNFEISLPTPIMAGLRSPQKQFSSCVLIETDDSLDSINATSAAIVKYVSQKAGIGIGAGRIRALGSPIRKGDTTHTGVIPFYKLFQASVKSCSQGGVRGGAATLYYPIWHLEVEDILVLKNNKGTEDNRVRHLDYGVQFNKVMYERLLSGSNITLFSPNDVPDLYDTFFTDVEKFRQLYEKYERSTKIRKKSIPAIDLFSAFMQERKDTGRIYLMNVDHANDHGSFIKELAPIRQSNLCCEIDLPTKPLNDIKDTEGEISLCTLSAINWGKIRDPADFERPCTLAVRALDELLDYQDYPLEAARRSTMDRRPLGVGIINLAYWLAKNDLSYQNIDHQGLSKLHDFVEGWSYYLIKASVELAMEKGACPKSNETKYAQGIMPVDTYKRDVDELVRPTYRFDWETLRDMAKKFGIRNSTLMALMPSETSAQIANATNGVEPPRSLVSIKQSKDGVLKQVVPEVRKLKNKYDLLWDQKSPEGYLKICSILQKFIDQGISVNTSYNPKFYEEEKIPMSEMIGHILMFYKYGGKCLYYFNTNDGAGEYEPTNPAMDELTPSQIDDSDCDSCKI